ncbi:MAG: ATP-binding protein [Deltaproteobacteria bacterium]|nr:ATP-binding protein [Deltaproteobacteria bacterium]MBW2015511.1 ATP-binding protein [Deltaproteobacteria bacterium]MBW2128740.1 ATP-binding protein [Deltaproteobacteria bacterium]MBW2302182.1 ATP-binding protein [Deltaproteobacteria bacterium]
MIISIASGKGGTGKTTVATNLALSLDPPVRVLDCDVEEPNAHLFLKPRFEASHTVTTPVPSVDEGKCSLCGKCGEICQFKAILVIGQTVLTFPEMCHSCGGCVEVCPEKAITETGRELGIIEEGRRDGVEFVHGRLKVGEAMAPPLIRKVRAYEKADGLTIIDAPPGTSCPVITSMKQTDFVILVTEPTPFGLHDLELAVGAVETLGIPCGLVINRSDLGDDRVREFARTKQIPLLMEIPFDRGIAEAYSRGIPFVEERPEWKEKFRALYQSIQKIVH